MSRDARLTVLCYDVSNNRRRRAIAKRLEEVASRVQYSVFEARLTQVALRRVTAEIEPLLAKGDSLRVYTIGRPGERRCAVIGSGAPIETEAGYWLL